MLWHDCSAQQKEGGGEGDVIAANEEKKMLSEFVELEELRKPRPWKQCWRCGPAVRRMALTAMDNQVVCCLLQQSER